MCRKCHTSKQLTNVPYICFPYDTVSRLSVATSSELGYRCVCMFACSGLAYKHNSTSALNRRVREDYSCIFCCVYRLSPRACIFRPVFLLPFLKSFKKKKNRGSKLSLKSCILLWDFTSTVLCIFSYRLFFSNHLSLFSSLPWTLSQFIKSLSDDGLQNCTMLSTRVIMFHLLYMIFLLMDPKIAFAFFIANSHC